MKIHLCSLLFLATVLMFTMGHVQAQDTTPESASAPRSSSLNSTAPHHEVHIPFHLDRYTIIVDADIGGKIYQCKLDTGTDTLIYPQEQHIGGQKAGGKSFVMDAGGHLSVTEEVVVPRISLGKFEVHNARAFEVQPSRHTGVASEQEKLPLLGNALFADVVLTIDYEAQVLILRDADYDFMHDPPKASADRSFHFALLESIVKGKPTVPVLSGTLLDTPMRIGVDTGWAGLEAGIDRKMLKRLQPLLKRSSQKLEKVERYSTLGKFEASYLPAIFVQLGDGSTGMKIKRPMVGVPMNDANVDAVIGPEVLRFFRCTFDYPHKRLLLEPYKQGYMKFVAEPVHYNVITLNGQSFFVPQQANLDILRDGRITFDLPSDKE